MLQYVTARVTVCYSVLQPNTVCRSMLQYVAVRVAESYSVLQCVAIELLVAIYIPLAVGGIVSSL